MPLLSLNFALLLVILQRDQIPMLSDSNFNPALSCRLLKDRVQQCISHLGTCLNLLSSIPAAVVGQYLGDTITRKQDLPVFGYMVLI